MISKSIEDNSSTLIETWNKQHLWHQANDQLKAKGFPPVCTATYLRKLKQHKLSLNKGGAGSSKKRETHANPKERSKKKRRVK